MLMLQFAFILLVGGFAGVLTGLMGASGVMAVVPGMLLLGYSAHQAVGVSLAVDMTASLVVAVTYFQHGRVEWRQGLWIAVSAVLGAQIGSKLSVSIPDIGINAGFGIVLLASAFLMWRNGARRGVARLQSIPLAQGMKKYPRLAGLVIGLYAGVYSGAFGAGGGMLFLFAMLLFGHSLHKAVGTSTLIMALTTASGTVGHALLGNLPASAMVGITGGTVLGSIASARLANQVSERYLERSVALILAILGLAVLAAGIIPGWGVGR